jgi:2-haloalkanoic acid dehalogenase type II
MINGVIFDLGSTLMYLDGDWKAVDAEANARMLEFLQKHGIAAGENLLSRFRAEREHGWKLAEETQIEHTVEQALQAALAQLGYNSPDGLVPQAVERFFSSAETCWTAYPDALSTLRALKERGLRLGLISNADDDGLVQRQVARLGFKSYLNPVISSAGFKWRKPNPRIFQHVAELWQLPPGQIAMVGDAVKYDIFGAHQSGMRGILIDRGDNLEFQKTPAESAEDPAYRPDATVGTLTEIVQVIDRL